MKWLKRLLGLNTPIDKCQARISALRVKAMNAQRNGDLRAFAELTHKIEELEDKVVEMIERDAK